MRFILFLAATLALAAQDRITVSIQRGTVTQTFNIDGAAATEAMRALDYYQSTQPGLTSTAASLRDLVVSLIAAQLTITPGSQLKTLQDTAQAAQAAYDKARNDYLTAAKAGAIQ